MIALCQQKTLSYIVPTTRLYCEHVAWRLHILAVWWRVLWLLSGAKAEVLRGGEVVSLAGCQEEVDTCTC